jgi:hypothetical protein
MNENVSSENRPTSNERYLRYKVVGAQTLGDLERAVESWRERGYVPTGGVVFHDVQTSLWYLQAVFLPDLNEWHGGPR